MTALCASLDSACVAAIMSGPVETRHIELAKLIGRETCGFTADDEKYIDMFWDPAFNGSWLYVSEEMVEHQMGYKRSKDMMNIFYTKMMKECDMDADYRQVNRDHPLVESYSGALQNRKEPSNRKKYYIISGNAFSELASSAQTPSGKKIRKYYRKVEQLCTLTIKTLLMLSERDNQQLIEDKKVLLEDKKLLTEEKIVLLEDKKLLTEEKIVLLEDKKESDEKLEKWGRVAEKMGAMIADLTFSQREVDGWLREKSRRDRDDDR